MGCARISMIVSYPMDIRVVKHTSPQSGRSNSIGCPPAPCLGQYPSPHYANMVPPCRVAIPMPQWACEAVCHVRR